MPTINQLSQIDSISGGDQIPLYQSANSDAKKASVNQLLDFIQANIAAINEKVTQYAAPNASGFSVQIPNASNSAWLILTPTGAFAAGTISLPLITSAVDKQEILVNTTQAITALTINGNGAGAVIGAPITLGQNAFFKLRFDKLTSNWYRVG